LEGEWLSEDEYDEWTKKKKSKLHLDFQHLNHPSSDADSSNTKYFNEQLT